MQNSSINFTGGLYPVSWSRFYKEIETIPIENNIKNYTVKGIKKANEWYTIGAKNCVIVGVSDGKNFSHANFTPGTGLHICPTYPENSDFQPIENSLDKQVDLASPNIQGFILGGDAVFRNGIDLFKKFQKYFNQRQIPFSSFIGHNKQSIDTAIAYKNGDYFFTNDYIDSNIAKKKDSNLKGFISSAFDSVVVSKKDSLKKV